MKRILMCLFTTLLSVPGAMGAGGSVDDGAAKQRVDDLLRKMTVEEKVGQMTQVAIDLVLEGGGVPDPARIDPAKLRAALHDYHVGSIINVAHRGYTLDEWHTIITRIQDEAKRTRLGVPVLYGIDAIHGANYTLGGTIFPQHIGMAATWNAELVRKEGEITAYEVRASGIPWNFNPVLDIGRHPAWPRLFETFGEDVHLSSVLAREYVRGTQGDDPSHPQKIAACLKHYVGYSYPMSGKDRTQAWIPERMLRQYFLPPFQAGVEAGALTVMVNSSENNGIPSHSDDFLLKTVLRDELGFKGFVVSDWEDVKRLHTRDRVAATPKEAVRMAVMAGIDMSMVPLDFSFYELLLELVKEGAVPMQRIDEAVGRILRVKALLGLFESAYPDASLRAKFACKEFEAVNLEAARESITLLKNEDGVLPLARTAKILVTGPTAHARSVMNGGWTITWQGDREDLYPTTKPTVLEALRQKVGEENVIYVPGATFDQLTDVDRAVEAARSVDAAVVCLGEKAYCETPGNIDDLELEEAQLELANRVMAAGKPVVLLLLEGRPRIIRSIADGVKGIVMAYLPGFEGGHAVADILFGDVNPSGRLPVTYPRFANALQTYDHKPLDVADVNRYLPQFPFGHGLSYTTFSYSNLRVRESGSGPDAKITVNVSITNTGSRAGKEVVQLYVTDLYGSVSRPVRELKAFDKILLEPGEGREVTFELAGRELMFVGRDHTWIFEPGQFRFAVGDLWHELDIR